MEEIEKPSYYAIIPANVRYDSDLKANEKLLYGEITALSDKNGFCYATNRYFAELYGVSKISISNWLSNLSRNGYISIQIIYKKGTKQIEKRNIFIQDTPIKEKFNRYKRNLYDPIKENFKENNTSNNNITPFIFSPLEKNHNFTCECNCKRKAKVEINGIKYCGQHGRIKLEELGKFEFSIETDEKEKFSFTLTQKKSIENTSKEYQTQLKAYIDTQAGMSYEDFYNQCVMKDYRYKNFKLAYDNWQRKATTQTKKQTRASTTEMSDFLIGRGVLQGQLQNNQELIEGEIYE